MGASPWFTKREQPKSRRDDMKSDVNSCRPFGALILLLNLDPRAHARGYTLPSLRDWGKSQPALLIREVATRHLIATKWRPSTSFIATKWRHDVATGVKPWSTKRKQPKSRRDGSKSNVNSCRPFGALILLLNLDPRAHARGYILPSLRDWGKSQPAPRGRSIILLDPRRRPLC